MNKIVHLPPHIIAKIAAGEVIERPAFAVKELIENAIDAKATSIQIHIEKAGLQKIQVTDNGEGMSKEDLEECWKPHTTSKIVKNDSLLGISSFGFRGEALASLAAVSHLTIKSRLANAPYGNQLEIAYGKFIRTTPIGMPPGTVIIAESLFSAVPARKKFLKSAPAELRHIVNVINNFTVAYPSIHFVLTHNNRILFNLPSVKNSSQRVEFLFGKDILPFLLPIHFEDSYIKISGFLVKPQKNSTTTSKQFIFINKRKITDRLISLAVKEAYGNMLEPTVYPLFLLFITIPFEMVDVNVHPRKEHVSFANNQLLFLLVKKAIIETLEKNKITFQYSLGDNKRLGYKKRGVGTTKSFAALFLRDTVLQQEHIHIENTPLIQLNKTYIVFSTKEGMVVTDQHAAHERVLYEKLKKEFLKQAKKQKTFQLKRPIILHLSKNEQLLLTEHKELFKRLGFGIAGGKEQSQRSVIPERPFAKGSTLVVKGGTQTLRQAQGRNGSRVKPGMTNREFASNDGKATITHIPYLFQDRDPQVMIEELLEDLEQESKVKDIDIVSQEMLAFLACRSAVKAGDSLQEEQMRKIIGDLETTPNNITCPHGRPTQITIMKSDIDIFFKRS